MGSLSKLKMLNLEWWSKLKELSDSFGGL